MTRVSVTPFCFGDAFGDAGAASLPWPRFVSTRAAICAQMSAGQSAVKVGGPAVRTGAGSDGARRL